MPEMAVPPEKMKHRPRPMVCMARVAIMGTTFMRLIMKPLKPPHTRPTTMAGMIRIGMEPSLDRPGIFAAIIVLMTPASAPTEPTEMSMPPRMMT